MHWRIHLPDNSPARLIVNSETERRLATTCFRGATLRRAGNFRLYERCEDVLRDEVVMRQFLTSVLATAETLAESASKRSIKTSVTISHTMWVGWESTDDISVYQHASLESFNLNKHATALRVKASATHLTAPSTNLLTIIYEIASDDQGWVVRVWSIYPGKHIGSLHGDVTARTRRIFFDWGHPGA